MSCEMSSLVEAGFDGRLGDKETASLARHQKSCAECRELEADLRELAALGRLAGDLPERTALDHRRERLALLREAAGPRRAASTSSPMRLMMLAAAVLATVFLMRVAFIGIGGVDGEPGAPADSRLASSEAIDANLTAVVVGTAGSRYERRFDRAATGRVHRVRLHSGTVSLSVEPLDEDERLVVTTLDAEVEVRGTLFSVTARAGLLTSVEVIEGRVEVRRGQDARIVAAGERWDGEVLVTGDGGPDREESPGDDAGATAAVPSVAPRSPRAATAAIGSEPVAAPTAPQDAESTADVSEPPAPPHEEQNTPTEPSVASRDFAAALGELENGRYGQARAAFDRFRRDHGGDPRVEDADFLAIVALQRADRHAAAAQAARAYLRNHPKGARRAEARAIAERTPKPGANR